jgi:TM2 domain-containing membrane protein YozV
MKTIDIHPEVAAKIDSLNKEQKKHINDLFHYRKKKKITAYILLFLMGSLGVHRFYLGRWKIGLLFLFTFGGLYLFLAIDALILWNSVQKENIKIHSQIVDEVLEAAKKAARSVA